MVYTSDTLFIANGFYIDSIPSQLTLVPSDRLLFVSRQQVTNVCPNTQSIAIEDMTVISRGAQPLPSESHIIADLLTVLRRMESLFPHYPSLSPTIPHHISPHYPPLSFPPPMFYG